MNVRIQDEAYDEPNQAESDAQPTMSKDSVLSDAVGEEDRVIGDKEAEDNDWMSCKPGISDDLGIEHDGLDMDDIEDCPSVFAGESLCNTIDLSTIINLDVNTADVMTVVSSKDCGQDGFDYELEIIPDQACFCGSTNKLADSVADVGDVSEKNVLNTTTAGLGMELICPDQVAAKYASLAADVPSGTASNVSQLASVKYELATSFLTPKTPTQSQSSLPVSATHFSFSSPDVRQNSPVFLSRPKTPVVSVSLPVRVHSQLSPHAPYTPDTPSVFQFPSPNQSPASSNVCSPASRHSKRHSANYHPYISTPTGTSSPRYLNQQKASAHQLEQQKRLEMEVAEAHSEIDGYIRQLQQADLQRSRQQLQMYNTYPKELPSKLSVVVPTETDTLSDTNNGSDIAAAVSPIEEVIQILVAEHFGVTVPSQFLQDDLKHSSGDSKVHVEVTNVPSDADKTDHQPVTDLFRNPHTVPASKPRKQKPEPLVIPASVSNFGFRSQLRSPKLCESGCAAQQPLHTSTPPYTPPPMISPARTGSGVFWTLHGSRQIPASCSTSFPCMCDVFRAVSRYF